MCLSGEDNYSPTDLYDACADGDFLRTVFSASRVQHVSDLHPKFALRPHHVWKYGRHPTAEIRRGKKEKRKKERKNRTKIHSEP